jgi:hypothetical protein
MIKRWLPSVVLLGALSVFVVVYVATTSNLLAGTYSAEQRQALAIHDRLRLTQAAPVSNFYRGVIDGELVGLEAGEADAPGVAATMGATDCRVRAALNARYEEVEGFTTTVYDLDFEGTYKLRYTGTVPTTTLELIFPFPTGLDTLNQVYFLVDGEEPSGVQYSLNNITWWTEMASGDEREVIVRYRARGVGSFRYALEHNRRLENLDVEVTVRGLTGSEVPDESLPTTAVETPEGKDLFVWHYDALIADRDVQVELPTRMSFLQRVEDLQEPLRAVARISPLFVALFVACLAGVHRLSGVQLPVQHYLLAGLGFFLFYPALTFLSGVLDLALAASVALVVVAGLLIVFLARAAGWRRTWLQTLLLCVVFLGLFSLGAMSHLRGLLFTMGGLLLVGAFMLLVARQRLSEPAIVGTDSGVPFEGPGSEVGEAEEPAEGPSPEDQSAAEPSVEVDVTESSVTLPAPPIPAPPSRYCPHCGGPLDEAFAFCPTCGRDARPFRRCPACGSEHYVSPEAELSHCPVCGEEMGE